MIRFILVNLYELIAKIVAKEKVFAMSGYSCPLDQAGMNVQPEEMLYRKYFVEDRLCRLIFKIKREM